MSPPTPSPRPRRPLLVPVLIAAVILAVIGAATGVALGARADRLASGSGGSGSDSPGSGGPGPGGPEADGTYAPAGDTPTEGATRCREETQVQGIRAGARGALRVRQVLRTRSSVVWICSDEAGRLYYHANRRNRGDAWIEGKTALFLPGVVYAGGSYETRSGSTTFVVSPRELVIVHRDGTREVQPAIRE